jgi:hypothetical protein
MQFYSFFLIFLDVGHQKALFKITVKLDMDVRDHQRIFKGTMSPI